MPRQPNPLIQPLLDGEMLWLENINGMRGRLGGLSQHMRVRGHRLHTRSGDGGIYIWAEETGVFETWSQLTSGKRKEVPAS